MTLTLHLDTPRGGRSRSASASVSSWSVSPGRRCERSSGSSRPGDTASAMSGPVGHQRDGPGRHDVGSPSPRQLRPVGRHRRPSPTARIVWFRTQTAQYAAVELGYPEDDMVDAWAATPVAHQRAVLTAMTQIGVPYRTHTQRRGRGVRLLGPDGRSLGAGPASRSTAIRRPDPQRDHVDRSTAKAGDLVHYPGPRHDVPRRRRRDRPLGRRRAGPSRSTRCRSAAPDSVRFGDPTG